MHTVAVLGILMAVLASGAAVAETSVKIGVLNDRSGPYSDLTGEGSVVAARLAVEDFSRYFDKNVKVEILSADHQNKPDVGASIARQWYDQNGVDLIVDVPTSSVAFAVHDLTKDKNKTLIISGAGSSDFTGPRCTANTVHWTYDTVSLANGTGSALIKRGGDTWFFLTADYAFGHALQRDTTAVITRSGGNVVGSVKTPFPTSDFSSFLLQAERSHARVIGLANSGADTTNSIKQASEFGLTKKGQVLAALLVSVADVHSLGLQVAEGLVFTEPFYWNLNEATRAFSNRFAKAYKDRMPTAGQAGVYSGVLHYLKAVAALGSTKDGAQVVAKMKAMPTEDPIFGKGEVRVDGRKLHDMYLFEAKKPAESKGEWDLYNLLATIPAHEAFRSLQDGNCPIASKSIAQ